MVTTAGCTGETSRETTLWSAVTTWAAATTGSAERWGLAPWPPRPWITILRRSTAAMSGPALTPMRAHGQLVPQVDRRGRGRRRPSRPRPPCPARPSRLPRRAGRSRALVRGGGAAPGSARPTRPWPCGRRGRRRASRRARARRRGPRSVPGSEGRPCRRAAGPCVPGRRRVGHDAGAADVRAQRRGRSLPRKATTCAAVRVSWWDSSGFWWRSRRKATRSARRAWTSGDRVGIRLFCARRRHRIEAMTEVALRPADPS